MPDIADRSPSVEHYRRLGGAILLGLGVALLLSLSACRQASPPPSHAPQDLAIQTAEGPVRLRVELAVTAEEQQRGLMGRTSLAPSSGMAFLFAEATTAGFWMKDTLIPLSIAFWDEHGRIIEIDEMTPCRHEPCPTYGPDVPYRGAVEANEGFFDGQGVEVGDTVEWWGPAG